MTTWYKVQSNIQYTSVSTHSTSDVVIFVIFVVIVTVGALCTNKSLNKISKERHLGDEGMEATLLQDSFVKNQTNAMHMIFHLLTKFY